MTEGEEHQMAILDSGLQKMKTGEYEE